MSTITSTFPTSRVENRLRELGFELPEVAAPLASYIPAVVSGEQIYTSGQLPLVDGNLAVSGKVGSTVSLDEARDQAGVCVINALAAMKARIGSLDRITQIVKVVGFVASSPDFTQQPAVVNGASELLVNIFGPAIGGHARSAVGAASLPLDAAVEIEIIARYERGQTSAPKPEELS